MRSPIWYSDASSRSKNVAVFEAKDHFEAKVLDFGIAKVLEADGGEATTVGRMLGSIAYLAPVLGNG